MTRGDLVGIAVFILAVFGLLVAYRLPAKEDYRALRQENEQLKDKVIQLSNTVRSNACRFPNRP